MTLFQIARQEWGKDWKKKVSKRLIDTFREIDLINRGMKPITSKLLKKALSIFFLISLCGCVTVTKKTAFLSVKELELKKDIPEAIKHPLNEIILVTNNYPLTSSYPMISTYPVTIPDLFDRNYPLVNKAYEK